MQREEVLRIKECTVVLRFTENADFGVLDKIEKVLTEYHWTPENRDMVVKSSRL